MNRKLLIALLINASLFLSNNLYSQYFGWARQIGGNNNESGYGITQDPDGNILTTGNFQGTCDFDPTGGTHNLTVQSGNYDIYVAKYDYEGLLMWANQLVTAEGFPYSRDIASDSSGNLYVCGRFADSIDLVSGPGKHMVYAPSGNYKPFVASYDPDGNFRWGNTLEGSGYSGIDNIYIHNNTIYIAGNFYGENDVDLSSGVNLLTGAGFYVSQYNTDGQLLMYFHTEGTSGYPQEVSIDSNGNINVAGYFEGTIDFDPGPGVAEFSSASYSLKDGFIAQYSPSGDYHWAHVLGDVSTDKAYTVCTDSQGNVFLGGDFSGTVDFDPGPGIQENTASGYNDGYILKFDLDGNYITHFIIGNSGYGTIPRRLRADDMNNIYILGRFDGTVDFQPGSGSYHMSTNPYAGETFFVKYNPSLIVQWGRHIGYGYNWNTSDAELVEGNELIITGQFFYNTVDFDPGPRTSNMTPKSNSQDAYFARYSPDHWWIGYSNNNWSTASNWSSNSVPNSNTNVTIRGTTIGDRFPTSNSSSSASAKNIKMLPGSRLTVPSGKTMTITENLVLNSNESNSASFINNGAVTISDSSYYHRKYTGQSWHLIASPVTDAVSGMFLGLYLQDFNENDNSWSDVIPVDVPVEKARGYALWNTEGGNMDAVYAGLFNSGTQSISLSYSGPPANDYGWNLVGNPYPSYIDWNAVNKPTSLDGAMWIYDPLIGDYRYFISGGGALNTTSQYVAPGQGFFVHCNDPFAGNLNFDNFCRTHSTEDFYKGGDNEENVILLTVSGNDLSSQTGLRFMQGATAKYDGHLDVYRLFGPSETMPFIWSSSRENAMAINTLPPIKGFYTIDLGFKCGKSGTYTIDFSMLESLTTDLSVSLLDKKNEMLQDIRMNPSYVFDYNEGEMEERFQLVFGEPEHEGHVSMVVINNYLHLSINSKDPIGQLNILDPAGRLLKQIHIDEPYSVLNVDDLNGLILISFIGKDFSEGKKLILN